MPSTLFRIATLPTVTTDRDGQKVTQPDDRFYLVGTLADGSYVLHGCPDTPIPKTAIFTYVNGSEPWTWDAFAKAQPQIAASCIPHEYAGEPTAASGTPKAFTFAQYPKAQPVVTAEPTPILD